LDDRLPLLRFCRHYLLSSGFEPAVCPCLCTHPLHRAHHIGFLRQEGIAEVGGPSDVVCQQIECVGKRHQGLDARGPILLPGGLDLVGTREVFVLIEPLLRFHNLERIGARGQHLA
jgi:hypothetical protein